MKLVMMWVMGICAIVSILYLTGCGQSRWCPTDPRVEEPQTGAVVVDETWRADVTAPVN